MKIGIYNKEGKKVSDYELKIDEFVIRDDIYKKVVLVEKSWFRQPYGASPMAGKKYTIRLSRRRNNYRGTYGRSISRIPRKVVWRRGTQFRFVGAYAPGTVGGRKAHPPKSWKNIYKTINRKEWILGFKTGLIASLSKEVVEKNGQKVPSLYPIILDETLNDLKKTKEFKEFLVKLGLSDELNRVSKKKVRAGKGKLRNRRYVTKRGPLLVVSDEENFIKASRNIPGFEVIPVGLLLARDFGMDIKPGRIVLFTKKAIEELKKEVLE